MVKSHMASVERPLFRLDQYIQQKKREVTRKPVFTEVTRSRFRDPTEMAHLYAYPNQTKTEYYSVVFKDTFYNRNKNQNLNKLKQVASHELAHIKVPNKHNDEFQETARKLGAGRYSNTRRG
jgi:hypothetical protein